MSPPSVFSYEVLFYPGLMTSEEIIKPEDLGPEHVGRIIEIELKGSADASATAAVIEMIKWGSGIVQVHFAGERVVLDEDKHIITLY